MTMIKARKEAGVTFKPLQNKKQDLIAMLGISQNFQVDHDFVKETAGT